MGLLSPALSSRGGEGDGIAGVAYLGWRSFLADPGLPSLHPFGMPIWLAAPSAGLPFALRNGNSVSLIHERRSVKQAVQNRGARPASTEVQGGVDVGHSRQPKIQIMKGALRLRGHGGTEAE